MTKHIRKASLIEIEYITKVLTDNNVNVEKVLVHSVTEHKDCTEYSIEVHHDDQCTTFNADKNKINKIHLEEKLLDSQEVNELIMKAVKDSILLHKYHSNIVPFIVNFGELTFVVRNSILSSVKSIENSDKEHYLKIRPSMLFGGIFAVSINSGSNFNKTDRLYYKSIRFTHDSVRFSYTGNNNDDIDLAYFKKCSIDDYFALSMINSISKELYSSMCELYKILDSIKYTQYKIAFDDDNKFGSKNKSLYLKSIKEYLKFDLEKHILDEIEREYADYIKIP